MRRPADPSPGASDHATGGRPAPARALGPVSKCLAGLRRAQTTTGRVGVSSGYNTGIQTKRRLAGSPPGPRLGSTEHFETGPSGASAEAGGQPVQRLHRYPVEAYLEVQVRTGRRTGRADASDELAAGHVL